MAEISVFILHPNEQHCMEIMAAVDALGEGDFVPRMITDLRHAAQEARQARPQIVLVGVDTANDPTIRVIDELSRALGDEGSIIVVTKNATRDVFLPCTRAGAHDFVDFPIDPAALADAIERQLQRKGLKTSTEGKVIALFSGKGGVGATLIACNLAVNVAKVLRTQNASCLVDLNVQFGVAAEMMDLKCKFNVMDAIRDAERMDSALLMDYISSHEDSGAHVLPAPPSFEDFEPPSPEDVGKILELCRDNFRFTFVDLPHVMDDVTIPVLDQVDEIFLICDLLFPTIKNTQKVMEAFRGLDYRNDKIKLILNGYYQSDKVSLRDINNALKLALYWLIPYDSLLARESIDAGVSVTSIGEGSDLAESLLTLAQHVTGAKPREQAKKKKKKKGGILGIFKS